MSPDYLFHILARLVQVFMRLHCKSHHWNYPNKKHILFFVFQGKVYGTTHAVLRYSGSILAILEIFYTLYHLQCIKLYFISGDKKIPAWQNYGKEYCVDLGGKKKQNHKKSNPSSELRQNHEIFLIEEREVKWKVIYSSLKAGTTKIFIFFFIWEDHPDGLDLFGISELVFDTVRVLQLYPKQLYFFHCMLKQLSFLALFWLLLFDFTGFS